MSLKRTKRILAACGLLFLMGMPASAQGLRDMQLFAPADLGGFGGPRKPNEGMFFCFDELFWHVQTPDVAKIGADGERFVATGVANFAIPPTLNVNLRPFLPIDFFDIVGYTQSSTADTSGLETGQLVRSGQRYEGGWITDDRGLMFSVFHVNKKSQKLYLGRADVFFDDPQGLLFGYVGDGNVVTAIADPPAGSNQGATTAGTVRVGSVLPVTFNYLDAKYDLLTWGVEVDYLQRSGAFHHGGFAELILGVRYLEFDDHFLVTGLGGSLDQSFWDSDAQNHIVGPQLGLRYFKSNGRWMINAEGRFTAGLNSQNIRQAAQLRTLPTTTVFSATPWTGSQVTHSAFEKEWSPLVELRLELRYLLTNAVSLRAGWTGIWMDGIARSPNLIEYSVPMMGINLANNRQDVLMHGFTFGVDINR